MEIADELIFLYEEMFEKVEKVYNELVNNSFFYTDYELNNAGLTYFSRTMRENVGELEEKIEEKKEFYAKEFNGDLFEEVADQLTLTNNDYKKDYEWFYRVLRFDVHLLKEKLREEL